LLILAFVPFQQLILHGQIGSLTLGCFTVAWLALRTGRMWIAGFALGSLFFKPTFLIAPALALAGGAGARVVGGVLLGVAVQFLVSSALLGTEIWSFYLEKVAVLLQSPDAFEPKPWQMHNLKGFWRLLLGSGAASSAAWLTTAAVVAGTVLYVWRHTRSSDLRVAALITGTVLVNPHLYVYDLIVLSVVFAALVRWDADNPGASTAPAMRTFLHLLWWAPLVGPFAMLTRLQFTPIVLVSLLWTIAEAARKTLARAPSSAGPESAGPTRLPAGA
jgi:hypothetical protein